MFQTPSTPTSVPDVHQTLLPSTSCKPSCVRTKSNCISVDTSAKVPPASNWQKLFAVPQCLRIDLLKRRQPMFTV